jgi:hypothetical protein
MIGVRGNAKLSDRNQQLLVNLKTTIAGTLKAINNSTTPAITGAPRLKGATPC